MTPAKPRPPGLPGVGDAMRLMQLQSEMLTELPATVLELQRSVSALCETLAATRQTMESAGRVSVRLESVLDEIEAPIRALTPGIARLAVALDDPVVERIPDTLRTIEDTVVPMHEGLRRLRERTGAAGGRARSLVARARSTLSRWRAGAWPI